MTQKLWGSAFKSKTDPLVEIYTSSIDADQILAEYDIKIGMAHAKMLAKKKIISKRDSSKIVASLNKMLNELKKGNLEISVSEEDIHTAISNLLKKKIGKLADKLHTGRSRNDLVVTDFKMYAKDNCLIVLKLLSDLQKALLKLAEHNTDKIVYGYTHLKRAQYISFSHYALAFMELFHRDKARIKDALKRLDTLDLGSCALSGTSLELDRSYVVKELGFLAPSSNSIDSVSSRDFAIEILSDLSILSCNISRLAEDFIIYSSDEFGVIKIDDSFTTGSSIMPHKKNPDILELLRGQAGIIYGNLMAMLTIMKGLPTSYNRDMQYDKEILSSAFEKTEIGLLVLVKLLGKVTVNDSKITEVEELFSVDLMEHLIKKSVSYRDAHDLIGQLLKYACEKGKKIKELKSAELKKFGIDEKFLKNLDKNKSVNFKNVYGGTAITQVRKQIKAWKTKISKTN